MVCKNCAFLLSGGEQYCPECGQALDWDEEEKNKSKDENVKQEVAGKIKMSRNSQADKEEAPTMPKIRPDADIFPKEPVYVYSREYDSSVRRSRSKKSAALTFLLIFLITVFGVGIFIAGEYLGFLPTISSNIMEKSTASAYEETSQTTVQGDYTDSHGLVSPQISYKPIQCFVSTSEGLSLRKGPGDGYAQISVLPNGTAVQVIGGSLLEKDRVYVYVPESDDYGWLCSSFLADIYAYETETEETSESEKQIENG